MRGALRLRLLDMDNALLRSPGRKFGLLCLVGLHKHGPTFRVGNRRYADCLYCGGDLIKAGHRWRPPQPSEVPARWKMRPAWELRGRAYAVAVAMLSIIVAAEAVYSVKLLTPN